MCPMCQCTDMIISQKRKDKPGGYYVCTRCWKFNDQYGSYGPPQGYSWQDKEPFWIGESGGSGASGGKAPSYKRPVPKTTPYARQSSPSIAPPPMPPRPSQPPANTDRLLETMNHVESLLEQILESHVKAERTMSKLIRQEPTLAEKFLNAQFNSNQKDDIDDI